MKNIITILALILLLPLIVSATADDYSYEQLLEDSNMYLQEKNTGRDFSYEEEYFRGIVERVGDVYTQELFPGYTESMRVISVRKIDDDKAIEIEHTVVEGVQQGREFKVGESVVLVGYRDELGEEVYYIHDYNRTGGLIIITIIFLVIIVYFGRVRGVGALLGLGFSALVLLKYIVPQIIAGGNPSIVTLTGSVMIASVSLFLAHGINRRTPIIWISTITTLAIAVGLSALFIDVANLFGTASDSSLSFQVGEYSHVSLKGLLLAGVVISVLGILDDVTATQTAVIWELKKSNPKLKFKDLYKRSLNVGREHIASLVSTLALVYAGSSLPLFIILGGVEYMPLWVKINSELIAEEVVRTIIGSSALILAVPIASLFAAYFIGKKEK